MGAVVVSDDRTKTFCIYDAPDPDAIRRTAATKQAPSRSDHQLDQWLVSEQTDRSRYAADLANGFSSADRPYTTGTATSSSLRYTTSSPRLSG
jgi:Protein of unknown function (DUF4242)